LPPGCIFVIDLEGSFRNRLNVPVAVIISFQQFISCGIQFPLLTLLSIVQSGDKTETVCKNTRRFETLSTMGGELCLAVVYGFKEPNWEYIKEVRDYGIDIYVDSNVGGNCIYGVLSQKVDVCTLEELQKIASQERTDAEKKQMELMNAFSDIRQSKAQWTVVMCGETEIYQSHLGSGFDMEMEDDEEDDEVTPIRKTLEKVKTTLQALL